MVTCSLRSWTSAVRERERDKLSVQWCAIAEALNNSIHSKGAHGYGSLILAVEPALLVSAALSAAFGLAMVVAGHLSKTGHAAAVPALLALSVYLLGLTGAILVPGSAQVAALLPILSVVLLLPGRTPRSAVVLVGIAGAGSVLALLSGDLPHVFAPMREPVASLFQNGALLGVTGLILVTLMDFAAGTRQSTDRLRQALRAEEATFAERTAIVASLGRLERKPTIEETAAVVVAALRRLPEIDLAAVFRCDDHDVDVLAMAGPEGFPVRSGDRLPDVRARHLLEQMSSGPGAERWEGNPAYADYGDASPPPGSWGRRAPRSSTETDHRGVGIGRDPRQASILATSGVRVGPPGLYRFPTPGTARGLKPRVLTVPVNAERVGPIEGTFEGG